MTPTLDTLPTTGRFIVDTDVDTYDIDTDTGIAIYHDYLREADGEHVDDEPFFYNTVTCAVGSMIEFDDGDRKGRMVIGITPQAGQ